MATTRTRRRTVAEKGRPRPDANATPPSFLRVPGPRLVLFGGKGGVGKTTTAAASALALATRHPDLRFLLLSTDPAHSLGDAFSGDTVPCNLEVREIDASARLEAWRRENGPILGEIAARGTSLTRGEASDLLGLPVPGQDEVMSLLEVASAASDDSFSRVLVDTAPAGHTLLLLALPPFLKRFVAALDALLEKDRILAASFGAERHVDECEALVQKLEQDRRRIRGLLARRGECELVLVTTPEPAVLEESRSLLLDLAALRVPVHNVVVDRLTPCGCDRCRRARLEEEVRLERSLPESDRLRTIRIERLAGGATGVLQLGKLGEVLREGGVPRASALALSTLQAGRRDPEGTPPRVLRLRSAASASALPDRPLLVFGGKGGVGKTTLAAAAALHLGEARPDERILLFSADPARTLSKVLGLELEQGETEIRRGLFAGELDAKAELAALRHRFRHDLDRVFGRLVAGTALDPSVDRRAASRLVDLLPPGLAEVLAFLRVSSALGDGRFDRVLLDTAPTGHLLRLLDAPELARSWASTFSRILARLPGGRALERLGATLREIAKDATLLQETTLRRAAALVAISVPTSLGYERTLELVAGARAVALPLGARIVNRLTPARVECPACTAFRAEEDVWAARLLALDESVPALGIETAERDLGGLSALATLGRLAFGGPTCSLAGGESP